MISIVVGAYNEEEVITHLINTFFKDIKLPENYELLIVDDGSTDKTKEIILNLQKKYKKLKLISYQKNKGLGNALKVGFKRASGRIIVAMDSDLSHPPKLISELIKKSDSADLVIGSRYIKGGGVKGTKKNIDMLSRFTNSIVRMLIGTRIRDVTSGFRAYNSSLLKKINFKNTGFEVEIEIFCEFLKRKARIVEIPLMSKDREKGESKFSLSREGTRYALNVLKIIIKRWL